MRAPPSTIFLTSREKRDPLGESQKRRRPRSLHNSTDDLVPPLLPRKNPMPTYTRLDARSSVFFCNPCAEVL